MHFDPTFKPLLAATALEVPRTGYPYYVSPKYDGIRAYVALDAEGIPRVYSRTNKLIPSPEVQSTFGIHDLVGLEGEIILWDAFGTLAPFNTVQSFVMTKQVVPFPENFLPHFKIFRRIGKPLWPEHLRYGADGFLDETAFWATLVEYRTVETYAELDEYYYLGLESGLEGVMLTRRGIGVNYKYGRSTYKEGHLIKLKPKLSSEYVCIGVVEEVDKHGEPKDTMGALVLQERYDHNGPNDFKVGTGFTQAQRKGLWSDPPIGKMIEVEYMGLSSDRIPRHPVFKSIRENL